MKAILLNDTASALHAGCKLVMGNISRLCCMTGITIADSISFRATGTFRSVLEKHSGVDMILINGEGTMHHDRPAALSLLQVARVAKQMGLRVVLFNTVWEENQLLNQYLSSFDRIFCRESLSTLAVMDAGFYAETVPDMVFATLRPPRSVGGAGGVAVIDSVSSSLSKRLALLSIRNKYRFLPISQSSYDRFTRKRILNEILKWRVGTPFYWDNGMPELLSGFDGIISGRFHGTCMSFLMGVPVVSVASNSHKTQGLYKDVGLDPETIYPSDKRLCSKELQKRIAGQEPFSEIIENYVIHAPAKILNMFQSICTLQKGESNSRL